MASEHWRRDKPTFYNFLALDRAPLTMNDTVGGLNGALMSHDPETDSMTFVVELPAAWQRQESAQDATVELFMLSGDVSLNGQAVGSGGFVSLPERAGGGELSSLRGGLGLLFWNPSLPSFPPPYTTASVKRVWDIPWQDSLGEGVHGEIHKSLRTPDPTGAGYDGGPGGFLRIAHLEPQLQATYEHVHDECWEEIIYLGGDTMLVDEGILGPGTVVSHPQGWWHGPFSTRNGAVILNHTDAPMGFPWRPRDYPEAQAICDRYQDSMDFVATPQHTLWNDVDPRIREPQDSSDHQSWIESGAAADFGNLVPLDASSKFRRAWRMAD